MLHFERWKIFAIVATVFVGILFALPNFFSKETVESWPNFLPKRQMPLGLDLQGGAHLLLALDQKELRTDWLNNLREDARRRLREAKIGFSAIGVAGDAVQVRLVKPEETDRAITELKKIIQPIGNLMMGTARNDTEVERGNEPGLILLRPTEFGIQERLSHAAAASIETINRRVNALGTAESTVVQQGRDRVLVQYPGLSDTTQLKELIGKTAKLSFHAVHPTVTADEAKLSRAPPGYRIYEAAEEEEGYQSAYVLQDVAVVQGDDLVDAQPAFDQQTNAPIITFRFNQSGARKFGNFSKSHVGEPFAIVLDDKVISAPVIREAILGGSGQISGNFTVESANNLAIQLRSGALPAKLTIVEERTVGPSLGADSIEAGKLAGIVGLVGTLAVTVFVYGTFGVYAVIGLLVHGFLILGLMSAIGTTLTLPGIAGFVLTIAMAVDANVLIYERIREELRAGRTPVAAIETGFRRAFTTIIDSQLTTLAAALIMFWLGSGPIRGFAVTLSLGILTSVFAAVTVTRLLVAMWLKNALKGAKRTTSVSVPI
ncbi:protein translocase subunit SecD [Hyphomicrobium sp. CS1GBMeth3]|uniref:protein translocase subunit SecD n=1 Tax=Hyphomicrobium sp. CS1GBMeth3 TaxID=1892845 RepID=UPI000931E4CC|nr:protein translocase subunit SecD [Hyphomicrobium sp. CS1GBMeth3]